MSFQTSWTLDALVAAYERHLRDAHGLRESSVQRYELHVRRFVRAVLGEDPVDVARLGPSGVVQFILAAKGRFRPRTQGLLTTSLRSSFRFLRAEGLCDARLEAAVPRVAQRRLSALPLGLTDAQLDRLLMSSAEAAGRGARRDRAILLGLARLDSHVQARLAVRASTRLRRHRPIGSSACTSTSIPHAATGERTPDEAYLATGAHVPVALASAKVVSRRRRLNFHRATRPVRVDRRASVRTDAPG